MEKIAAIILAAGSSSRMGQPKQLLQFRNQTLLRRMVDAAFAGGCAPVAVVVGAERDRLLGELAETKGFVIENPTWERGIGNSIRAGLSRLLEAFPKTEAVLVLACDQPSVDASAIAGLRAKAAETKKPIVASRYAQTLGVPALFAWNYFDALLTLDDDAGAKKVILDHKNDVAEYPFPEGAIDIDTADDYAQLVRQHAR
jgi:molybdenum cofactor cytidylyltransferase